MEESLETVLRQKLSPDQYLRYESIAKDFRRAIINGTYHPRESHNYTQRFLNIIGYRPDLRSVILNLPWVPFKAVPLPGRRPTVSEDFYEKVMLSGLEQELAPEKFCRFILIFNAAKHEVAAGRLDEGARRRYFQIFKKEVGGHRDVLARACMYLASPRPAESYKVEIAIEEFSKNMLFIVQFTLNLNLDIKGLLNEEDFNRCMLIWRAYRNLLLYNGHAERASREAFQKISEVLRPHQHLMQIILAAPWPHLKASPPRAEQ